MMIIKLLKPFEKTLENRRFKIILYLLTSIILAPVAAYLEHIGLRPVYIIWCIWLLIIPVTYGIYFLWSCVSVSNRFPELDMSKPVRRMIFNNKDDKPLEPELALQLELNRIVGRIAHSIKNPLVSIHTFLQLYEERLDDPSFLAEFGSVAKRDLERLNRLLEQLLTLVEPRQHQFELMDINVLLNECVTLLREETADKSLEIVTDLAEAVLLVKCDREVMKRALWYLMKYLTNTMRIFGTLSIVSFVPKDFDEIDIIRIIMTGKESKVSKEEIEKLFDPLAVVQDADIDLGPCASQKMIEEHGGHIKVKSEKAGEICFVIDIPY